MNVTVFGDRERRPASRAVAQARRLRREMTVAERDLWAALRALDQGWRRQAPLGPYIVDFVRHKGRLIVEVDGYFHDAPERQEKDVTRTKFLNEAGYRVIRFSESVVRNRLQTVVEQITGDLRSPFPLEGGRVGDGGAPTISEDQGHGGCSALTPFEPIQPDSEIVGAHPLPRPLPLRGGGENSSAETFPTFAPSGEKER